MKSKKGVIITAGILIAITIASFSVWVVNNPSSTEMTIVVTDFENHQEGISERHKIVSNAIEESFSELMHDRISPEEWHLSDINRIGSLETFRSYIIETMVMANVIMDNGSVEKKTEILSGIEMYKDESIQYAQMADSSKP